MIYDGSGLRTTLWSPIEARVTGRGGNGGSAILTPNRESTTDEHGNPGPAREAPSDLERHTAARAAEVTAIDQALAAVADTKGARADKCRELLTAGRERAASAAEFLSGFKLAYHKLASDFAQADAAQRQAELAIRDNTDEDACASLMIDLERVKTRARRIVKEGEDLLTRYNECVGPSVPAFADATMATERLRLKFAELDELARGEINPDASALALALECQHKEPAWKAICERRAAVATRRAAVEGQ